MFLPLDTKYQGHRNARSHARLVMVGRGTSLDRRLLPGPSQAIVKHSDEFEWGYGGSGPAQLALAILLDFTRDRDLAEQQHQEFKWAYVADWNEVRWTISGAEIVAWLQQSGAAISADMIP